jgi:hypothetical protein
LQDDWKERMLAQESPPQELSRQAAECSRLLERLQRVQELYLAGDIDRERYAQEQADCRRRLVELTDHTATAIQSAARMFEMSEEEWVELTRLKKKVLMQSALARATVVRNQLTAVQPTSAAYPLIEMALRRGPDNRCHSGSDGNQARTRIPVVTFLPNQIGLQGLLHKSPSPVLAQHSPRRKLIVQDE